MLEKEFKYYLDHQTELVEKFNGKFIVIKNEKVIGVYDTKNDAYFETIKTEKLGTFIIQLCTPGPDAYTQISHARVIYANDAR